MLLSDVSQTCVVMFNGTNATEATAYYEQAIVQFPDCGWAIVRTIAYYP